MKALIVTPLYEPAWQQGGGVVTCLATLCRALARDHDVTVYTTNVGGPHGVLDVPVGEPADQGGVRVLYFKSTFGAQSAFDSRQLRRHLRQNVREFDVVYIVALWQWIGVSAANICLRAGVPFIIGIHGGFSTSLRTKSRLAKWFFRNVLLRTSLKKAAGIHLTAEAEKAHAGTWLDGLNCFVVPNCVDPTLYHYLPAPEAQFRDRYGIPKDSPVMVCVGRPDWKKRVELLIAALEKKRNWYLVFVGDTASGKAPEWKEYAERIGVAERVRWTGFLLGEELLAAFSNSDVFALVSESENFGMVVIEAMLSGLPVLISKEVGVREYIQDQPFVLTCDRSADAVAQALDRAEQRLPGVQAGRDCIRQYAIDRFAPEQVARHFSDEIQRLVPAAVESQ